MYKKKISLIVGKQKLCRCVQLVFENLNRSSAVIPGIVSQLFSSVNCFAVNQLIYPKDKKKSLRNESVKMCAIITN
jgi:hypothetical protein